MFAPTALGARISDQVTEGNEVVTNRHVAPIGPGYFHVHSRSRVTRDGGHSILAIPDPDSTTRIGRVHTRSDSRASESTVNVGSDEGHGSGSAPAKTPAATAPPSALFPPTPPMHRGSDSASTVQPPKRASQPAVPHAGKHVEPEAKMPNAKVGPTQPSRVVDMSAHGTFLPLLRFVLGVLKPGDTTKIKITMIQQWFSTNMPQVYGTKLTAFKKLCHNAVKLGLLASDGPLPDNVPQLKTVALVSNARYCNY